MCDDLERNAMTGVIAIDADHLRLIRMVRAIEAAAQAAAGPAELIRAVRDFLRHLETHYRREEALFLRLHHPMAKQIGRDHEHTLILLETIVAGLERGEAADLLDEVRWIRNLVCGCMLVEAAALRTLRAGGRPHPLLDLVHWDDLGGAEGGRLDSEVTAVQST